MSFIKTGFSAIGKLFIVMALAGAFLVGMVGVVYLSLRGEEIQVPEIIGKNREEAEKELTSLGLKMKKRADRYSEEKPNTILEQSPKAGTTAKTGQQILVVVSQVNPESSEAPATVVKEDEEEDSVTTDPDKPKKPTNKNANVKKPAQTSRDVSSNKAAKTSNSNVSTSESNTAKSNTGLTSSPANKAGTTNPPANKSTTTPTNSPKPAASKTPTSGDTRTRKVPN